MFLEYIFIFKFTRFKPEIFLPTLPFDKYMSLNWVRLDVHNKILTHKKYYANELILLI